MSETFKAFGVHARISSTDVYTVPTGFTAMVLFAQAANVNSVNTVDATLRWHDASLNDTFQLASAVSIPAKSALGLIDNSKLVLEEGDIIQALASTDWDVDITISILEMSN